LTEAQRRFPTHCFIKVLSIAKEQMSLLAHVKEAFSGLHIGITGQYAHISDANDRG